MVRIILFVAIGAIIGFVYQRLVGCGTGGCPITSNPYLSTLFGATLGYVLSGGAG